MTIALGSPVDEVDIEQFAQLADHVFFGGAPSFRARYPVAFSLQNAKNILVARDDNKIVAGVAGYPARLRLARGFVLETLAIGAVCTHEEYRGNGLSGNLLELMRARAAAAGIHLLLISGTGPLYRRLGGREVGLLHELHLERDAFSDQVVTYQRHVSPPKEVVDTAWASSQREVLGFDRTREEFAQLLRGALHPFREETAALLVPENAPGYAIVRTGIEGSERVGFLVEYAGDPALMMSIAIDESRAQGSDRFYTRMVSPPTAPWPGRRLPIAMTGVLAFANVDLAISALFHFLQSRSSGQLDLCRSEDGVEIRLKNEVLFTGAEPELLEFFWGHPGGGVTTNPWVMPSFRTDTLNFL